ncbi:MAG: site-specific integrase [Eggerthellaceae bacterium]|nr:site-specific integrase [Eggerthellaceae bacterium]
MANGYGNGSIIALEKGKDGKKKPRNKCRKWRLVVSIGRDPHGMPESDVKDAEEEAADAEEEPKPKKPKQRYRQKAMNFQGTYTEAQEALREFREKVMNGDIVTRNSWTFDEYGKHYVETRLAAGEIEKRSADSFKAQLRMVGYLIGSMKMQEITTQVIETAYADLRAGKSRSGRKISGTSLNDVNKIVWLVFEDASDKGVIGANPLDKMAIPRRDTKERRALSPEAYRDLMAALDPKDRMQCAVLLCAALGLRRSESLALSWGDIDFERNTIDVHCSCDDYGGLKSTKTKAGERVLPMPGKLSEALMARKAEQAADLVENESESVFQVKKRDGEWPAGTVELDGKHYEVKPAYPIAADQYGVRPLPASLTGWWTKHRAEYGLDDWTLHELRHSFLSRAAASGVHPAVMQKLAGHSSARTTMDIYTHVNVDAKRAAMELMQMEFM